VSERAGIIETGIANDGLPFTSFENAEVRCPECEGWKGTVCPHGCGVRLVSTQAEDTAKVMAELRERDAESKRRRDERRQRRASGSAPQHAPGDSRRERP